MTLNGIDVSHWQDASASKNAPYDFLIAKATEGTGFVDQLCNTHVANAKARGKPFGVYHFANAHKHPGTSGAQAEADYFLKNVAGYIGEGVLVLDWEADSVAQGPAWAKAWCDRVYSKTGIRPWFYTYASALKPAYSVLADYPLWLAKYGANTPGGYRPSTATPSISPWKTITCFQYCSQGRLSGYSGNLDLDVFYGNAETWGKLAGKASSAPEQITVDGSWGAATTKALQRVLGTTVDGVISNQPTANKAGNTALDGGWEWKNPAPAGGSTVIRALQAKLGTTVDGYFGPGDIKALGARYGYTATGLVYPSPVVKALQTALNKGVV